MLNFTSWTFNTSASAVHTSANGFSRCCGIALLLHGVIAYSQEEPESKPFELCVAEKVTYDSNLYRLPASADVTSRLGPDASRDDYMYSTSACANGNWHLSRQDVLLKAEVSDNRFQRNDILDNVSGNAGLMWSWQTIGNWAGKFGAGYSRALGTFYNDRPLTKDVVDSYNYLAELRHPIVGNLNAVVGAQGRFAEHGAAERAADDFRSNDGKASVEYVSRSANVLAVDYRFSKARYPTTVFFDDAPLARNYDERVIGGRLKYSSRSDTTFTATAGYLKRRYEEDASRDYSGGIGRASLQWQPSEGFQVVLSGWRELSSYFDAESNYFVSRGVSLIPVWTPRTNLKIAPVLWWEKQQYLSNSLVDITTDTTGLPQREDKVVALGGQISWSFLRYLELGVAYRHEQHDSNRELTGYEGNIASAKLTARF